MFCCLRWLCEFPFLGLDVHGSAWPCLWNPTCAQKKSRLCEFPLLDLCFCWPFLARNPCKRGKKRSTWMIKNYSMLCCLRWLCEFPLLGLDVWGSAMSLESHMCTKKSRLCEFPLLGLEFGKMCVLPRGYVSAAAKATKKRSKCMCIYIYLFSLHNIDRDKHIYTHTHKTPTNKD